MRRTSVLLATALVAGGLTLGLNPAPAGAATSIAVTTATDELNGTGAVSLREAVGAANLNPSAPVTIQLQAGVSYVLTACGSLDDNTNSTGDLDLSGPTGAVVVEGHGATISQSCPNERVLDLRSGSAVTLNDLTVLGGSSAAGGAISTTVPTTLHTVAIEGGTSPYGGGVHVQGSASSLRLEAGSEISGTGGPANLYPTAIYNIGGHLEIVDSSVHDNQSSGLSSDDAQVDVLRSAITGNGASTDVAGGISVTDGLLTITDSLVANNQGAEAGGIRMGYADMDLVDTTVSGNSSGFYGGGIYGFDSSSDLGLDGATVVGNTGGATGGDGVRSEGTLTARRSVILDGAGAAPACSLTGAPTSLGANVDDDGSCGFGAGAGDQDDADLSGISLGPLADNGGPTESHLPGPLSVLVDSGGAVCPAVDQRGEPRPVDGDFDGELRCDVGAVERGQNQAFTDVPPSHDFFTEIGWMALHGISLGSQPGPQYKPAASVSRQAMSAFLYRMAGSPTFTPGAPTFSDVPVSNLFFTEIEWMNAEGITTGFAGGLFKPAQAVSRQSMSAFMHRMAGSPAGPFPAPPLTDVGPSNPFFLAISWMAFTHVTEGFPDHTYRPSKPVSRQAMSAFMFRLSAQLP